ncbi:hypothetical protein PY365_28860 [Roseiarcaceae bacterium H3SJ34-1]|uniref:hypothetical protein n=1 Tax=Terripilifer ovatus TaxID=3032367 RepID=UPI003AB96D4C|nr:hypothetical protein [Roseiarcaceae bacterium H3SJ34-1]
MSKQFLALSGAFVVGCSLLGAASPASAQANVMKACGEKYQAAKADKTLGTQTWNQYLAACRKDMAAATPAAASAAPAAAPAKPAMAPAAPAAAGNAVFPTAISPKFSTLSAGKQRQQTCLEQYNANKETNSNGGLKWIQKGGGYYSQCNARLKGA